ncbi:hypothetical protein, partial [Deefgea salmonis]
APMIVRIARVKVGHCQTPHTRKPDSKESGFLLSGGYAVVYREWALELNFIYSYIVLRSILRI